MTTPDEPKKRRKRKKKSLSAGKLAAGAALSAIGGLVVRQRGWLTNWLTKALMLLALPLSVQPSKDVKGRPATVGKKRQRTCEEVAHVRGYCGSAIHSFLVKPYMSIILA